MDRDRMAGYRDSLPFYAWYAGSPYLERQGQPGVVDLLFGNPHELPMPAYVEALRRHAEPQDPGWFAYMFSLPAAAETVARDLSAHTAMAWRPEDVVMTTGGWGAIALAVRMLTQPGDEVLYFDPPWFFYEVIIRGAEAVPVALRLDAPRFSPDPDRLAAAITPRTRAVLLNTPHNPSGRVLDAAELAAVAEVLRDASRRFGHPIWLLSDEAYRRIVFDGRRAPSPAEHHDHTLVLYSYGKQLLAPMQRIGYLAISPRVPEPEPLREAAVLTTFVNAFSFPNALLQRALPDIAGLCVDLGALQRRRDRLVPALADLGYEPTLPEGTFYIMARSPDPDDAAFVARLAADDTFVLPGSTVATPGWFRISLTGSDQMVEAAIPRFAAARAR